MLEELRQAVCRANRMLAVYGLVCLTRGNMSVVLISMYSVILRNSSANLK